MMSSLFATTVFTEKSNEIVVTWSTRDDTIESIVEYIFDGVMQRANGSSQKFVDGGDKKKSQYIHRVKLLFPFLLY